MSKKPLLYIDVDDTLLSTCFLNSGFDLRPGVVTQISILAKIFDCHWLTHWKKVDLDDLWTLLYAHRLKNEVTYANWREIDPSNKAVYVLSKDHNFYWVEDTLSTGKLSKLKEENLLDRYIPVESKGLFGFTRALQELFRRAGIKDQDIKKVGGNPQWFREPLTKDYFDFTYIE